MDFTINDWYSRDTLSQQNMKKSHTITTNNCDCDPLQSIIVTHNCDCCSVGKTNFYRGCQGQVLMDQNPQGIDPTKV